MKEKLLLAGSVAGLAIFVGCGWITAAQALEFARTILELVSKLSMQLDMAA